MFEKTKIPENIRKILTEEIRSKRVPHAYIFDGPEKEVKIAAAAETAKILNCENGTGCGLCAGCLGILNGRHPDVNVYSSDTTIKIADIREFIRFMTLSKMTGACKVGIITEGELLTEAAANALLKILEEPPENSCMIIITSNLYTLLATIRSRCQILRFPPMESGYERIEYDRKFVRESIDDKTNGKFGRLFTGLDRFFDDPLKREKTSNLVRGLLIDEAAMFRQNPSGRLAGDVSYLLQCLNMLKKQRIPKVVYKRMIFNGVPSSSGLVK
ncbi:MAG: hypothetical protein ABIJ15_07670 [bacterium]